MAFQKKKTKDGRRHRLGKNAHKPMATFDEQDQRYYHEGEKASKHAVVVKAQ